MRLDKYLKVSRIIKRRTVANDACDADHVTVNGRRAKASYDVKEGDVLVVIEAMKMENDVVAPRAGTITQVSVPKGATVNTGDTLVVLS